MCHLHRRQIPRRPLSVTTAQRRLEQGPRTERRKPSAKEQTSSPPKPSTPLPTSRVDHNTNQHRHDHNPNAYTGHPLITRRSHHRIIQPSLLKHDAAVRPNTIPRCDQRSRPAHLICQRDQFAISLQDQLIAHREPSLASPRPLLQQPRRVCLSREQRREARHGKRAILAARRIGTDHSRFEFLRRRQDCDGRIQKCLRISA